MKRCPVVVLFVLLIAASISLAGNSSSDYVPGVLLIRFTEPVEFATTSTGEMVSSSPEVNRILSRFKASEVQPFLGDYILQDVEWRDRLANDYKLFFPSSSDMELIGAECEQLDMVEFATPDWLLPLYYTPDDPSFGLQWWLTKISADAAWDVTSGDEEIIVVAIDSGTDWNHPDMIEHIWINPGEDIDDDHYPYDRAMGFPDQPGTVGDWNNADDDMNGLVDDFIGWDWVHHTGAVAPGEDGPTPDNNPMDFDGHGTGCASAMAAIGDNGVGGLGVAYNCKIMASRSGYTPLEGIGSVILSAAAQAIYYATDKGVMVINLSFGGDTQNTSLRNSIQYAWNHGALLFGATGNDGVGTVHYPSNYDHVISVAATTSQDERASFSNWGDWVEVAAPGEGCYTCWFNDSYSSWDGTSVAGPIAAGVGALVIAMNPDEDNEFWRQRVIDSTDPCPNADHPIGTGRVNAYKAVTQNLWPELEIEEWTISDPDGNGHPDINEEISVTFRLSNAEGWQDATDVTARIEVLTDGIEYGQQEVNLGGLAAGNEILNTNLPLSFTAGQDAVNGRFVMLRLAITCGPNDYEIAVQERIMLGTPPILLVDDDGGEELENWIIQDLDDYDYAYFHHDTNVLTSLPDNSELDEYNAIVWMTGNASDPFSDVEIASLQNAMDNGVNVFLFGQKIDDQLAGTTFYSNYLHAQHADGNTQMALTAIEDAGGPVVENSQLVLVGPGGASNSTDPDVIEAIGGAHAAYYYLGGSNVGALWYSGDYNLVYFPFAFEAVSGASNTTSRLEVLFNIMEWFNIADAPEQDLQVETPTEFALTDVYPNPFNSRATVGFTLPQAGHVELHLYDVTGRRVATLLNGSANSGQHTLSFDGETLSSGVYFLQLSGQGLTDTRKLTLIK